MIFSKDTILLCLKYIQSPRRIMFSSHIAKNVQSFFFYNSGIFVVEKSICFIKGTVFVAVMLL